MQEEKGVGSLAHGLEARFPTESSRDQCIALEVSESFESRASGFNDFRVWG